MPREILLLQHFPCCYQRAVLCFLPLIPQQDEIKMNWFYNYRNWLTCFLWLCTVQEHKIGCPTNFAVKGKLKCVKTKAVQTTPRITVYWTLWKTISATCGEIFEIGQELQMGKKNSCFLKIWGQKKTKQESPHIFPPWHQLSSITFLECFSLFIWLPTKKLKMQYFPIDTACYEMDLLE